MNGRPIPTAGASENGTVPVEAELPDHVIEAMLQRELLLTNAKLHGLANEHSNNERKLRSLRTQLRQVSGCAVLSHLLMAELAPSMSCIRPEHHSPATMGQLEYQLKYGMPRPNSCQRRAGHGWHAVSSAP